MISTSFQQPLLGSNFLLVSVSPSPEGGLTDGTKAEVRSSGRLFEFAAALDKTRERVVEAMRTRDPELEDGLRELLGWDFQVLDVAHTLLATYSTGGPASELPGPSTATGGGLDLPPAYS